VGTFPVKIQLLAGPEKGKTFAFGDPPEIVIGRDEQCHAQINDPELSRRHARVYRDGEALFVEDLNSTNGTVVNGRQIVRHALSEADEILVGETVLTVVDLPFSDPLTSSTLRVQDKGASVLLALHYQDADLLSGSGLVASEAEHENMLLRQVCEVSQVVASEPDAQAILSSVLSRIKEILSADTACVVVRSGDGEWAIRALPGATEPIKPIRVSRTIVSEAIREGKAVLSMDPKSDDRFAASESIVDQGITSAFYCPLNVDGEFVGVLALDRRMRADMFEPIDLRLAATVANILGVVLEKEKLQEEMREQAKLAVIGEVVAGLAHYAKNIITGLRLNIGFMRKILDRYQVEGAGNCVESLLSQERRISNLILDMLSYAKDRVPERTEVQLETLMNDVTSPYAQQMEEEGVILEISCDPGVPSIRADETSLHRVFLNLLLNSLESFEGGDTGREPLIKISVGPIPGKAGVEIRFFDTGCGIPEEKVANIFDVFYSTKGSKGTGLGLAVIHKIVKEHGGEITVDSKEGEWTEFRITLLPDAPAQGE